MRSRRFFDALLLATIAHGFAWTWYGVLVATGSRSVAGWVGCGAAVLTSTIALLFTARGATT